jgi:hypothetical protein
MIIYAIIIIKNNIELHFVLRITTHKKKAPFRVMFV